MYLNFVKIIRIWLMFLGKTKEQKYIQQILNYSTILRYSDLSCFSCTAGCLLDETADWQIPGIVSSLCQSCARHFHPQIGTGPRTRTENNMYLCNNLSAVGCFRVMGLTGVPLAMESQWLCSVLLVSFC